jgi:hypothetical protein
VTGPYTLPAWTGFAICNVVIPFMRGLDGESFWLTLIFAPLWGVVFVIGYGKTLREVAPAWGLIHFVLFNTILTFPAVLASFWVGRLVA